MEPTRFDRWTKAVAKTGSRRSALRGLAGLGVGAIVGRRLAAPAPAAAGACAGFGCPCAHTRNCISGLICCGNSCQTSGYCGQFCTGTGDACPTSCTPGNPCADCCGGFCAAYGACTTIYYSYEGGACSLADPTACAPGLTCCPTIGGDAADGVCHDVCS